MTCRACNGAGPDEAQFCPHCGIPIRNASSQPTVYTPSPDDVTMARPELRLSRAVTPPPGQRSAHRWTLSPGMLLGGRYRIAQWSRMTLLHRSHEIVALSS
jgi:hypothetical protein